MHDDDDDHPQNLHFSHDLSLFRWGRLPLNFTSSSAGAAAGAEAAAPLPQSLKYSEIFKGHVSFVKVTSISEG